jgi:RNA recognition motif-containing protein
MADDADADKAIDMFHDKEFDGRRLTVNVARPKEDRPARRDW